MMRDLDPAMATLLRELDERNLLDDTLVVWMGEFGRTPTISRADGRDHYPTAWSTVLAGGGIRGGQAYGATDETGAKVNARRRHGAELLRHARIRVRDGPREGSYEPRRPAHRHFRRRHADSRTARVTERPPDAPQKLRRRCTRDARFRLARRRRSEKMLGQRRSRLPVIVERNLP